MDYKASEIETINVESSNVTSLGYSDKHKIMIVTMQNCNIFLYKDIPRIHFDTMITNNKNSVGISSIGSYLHRNVYGNYRYEQVYPE